MLQPVQPYINVIVLNAWCNYCQSVHESRWPIGNKQLSCWMKFSQADCHIKTRRFSMFRELTPSPSSGRAGGLVEQKLTVIKFGSTKSPAHPEYGDRVSSWNVGKPLHLDAAVCLRKFHWILLLQNLQDLNVPLLNQTSVLSVQHSTFCIWLFTRNTLKITTIFPRIQGHNFYHNHLKTEDLSYNHTWS